MHVGCGLEHQPAYFLNLKTEATSEHSKSHNEHKTQLHHPIAQYYDACVRGSGHGKSAKPLVGCYVIALALGFRAGLIQDHSGAWTDQRGKKRVFELA